jgi:hypothetical protein
MDISVLQIISLIIVESALFATPHIITRLGQKKKVV